MIIPKEATIKIIIHFTLRPIAQVMNNNSWHSINVVMNQGSTNTLLTSLITIAEIDWGGVIRKSAVVYTTPANSAGVKYARTFLTSFLHSNNSTIGHAKYPLTTKNIGIFIPMRKLLIHIGNVPFGAIIITWQNTTMMMPTAFTISKYGSRLCTLCHAPQPSTIISLSCCAPAALRSNRQCTDSHWDSLL